MNRFPESFPAVGNVVSVRAVPVWDRFIRVFHWSLVACVMINFFVVDDGEILHRWLGYTASILVCARVIWGFIGPRHARFADFFPTPTRLRTHLAALRAGTRDHHDGHNPAGALVMLAMLAVVLALGATGFLQTTDAFWGESWLKELHEALAATLIGAAGLHAMAAIVMSHLERTNLIKAMFTGIKERRG